MERKKFLKTACALCGVAIAGGMLSSCKKTTAAPSANFTVDLSNTTYAALNGAGGGMLINQLWVINTDGANFIAVSSLCTHEGCTVEYIDVSSGFGCPCHGAAFTTTGTVTRGPASTNLKKYTVTKSGNVLTVTG